MKRVKGTKLWEVEIHDLRSETLWITGPISTVISKAVKVALDEHGIEDAQIDSIKYRGTLDA